MGPERRGCVVQPWPSANWKREEPVDKAKPFKIPKREVWEARGRVPPRWQAVQTIGTCCSTDFHSAFSPASGAVHQNHGVCFSAHLNAAGRLSAAGPRPREMLPGAQPSPRCQRRTSIEMQDSHVARPLAIFSPPELSKSFGESARLYLAHSSCPNATHKFSDYGRSSAVHSWRAAGAPGAQKFASVPESLCRPPINLRLMRLIGLRTDLAD